MKMQKTNAARLLDKAGIEYELIPYEVDENDLAAGHVEEVRTDPSGMTRYAVLIPETDLAGLQQVFVIKDFEVVE